MKVYQVWDHDPMDGSYGKDYLAETYRKRSDAQHEVDRRNAEWRKYFENAAIDGKRRAETETWCWQHARLVESTVK